MTAPRNNECNPVFVVTRCEPKAYMGMCQRYKKGWTVCSKWGVDWSLYSRQQKNQHWWKCIWNVHNLWK